MRLCTSVQFISVVNCTIYGWANSLNKDDILHTNFVVFPQIPRWIMKLISENASFFPFYSGYHCTAIYQLGSRENFINHSFSFPDKYNYLMPVQSKHNMCFAIIEAIKLHRQGLMQFSNLVEKMTIAMISIKHTVLPPIHTHTHTLTFVATLQNIHLHP